MIEDTKTIVGAVTVLCTVVTNGSVGANGEAETTVILNAKGETVTSGLGGLSLLGTGATSGEGSECRTVKTCAEGTAASPIELTPLGLPWHALLFQHETTGTFLLLSFSEGELGYELLCLILGIDAEDKCTSSAKDFEIEVLNAEEDAAIPASAQTSPLALCSQSGEESGHYTLDELAFILPLSGLLSISSSGGGGGGGGGSEATTLSTTLSGEGKEAETITVLEGSKVKDKAALKGKNASTATGKVTYKVYSDSACKTLVTTAGEVTVSGESVPASTEVELEGGASYYWQAHYGGDSKNSESTSGCTEISNIKAKTSLSTKLSGEGKEGEGLTILEGSKAKDKATLSGTKSSTAGGKASYKVYADGECKTLVKEAGETTVAGGSVPASNEQELEGGKTYYWQVHYTGDGLHQESTSTCNKEVLNVKAATTITTKLSSVPTSNEETVEGNEITVASETAVADAATLHGTNSASATGTVKYFVYSDVKCKELAAEAGEAALGGSPPYSTEEEFSPGVYYWRAEYGGDPLHQASTSSCTEEVATVTGRISLATSLSGGGHSGAEITVNAGTAVTDTATLAGPTAPTATGKVTYKVYSDNECKELVAEAGDVTALGETAPPSLEEKLGPGTYYWQASYSGDELDHSSKSVCGSEISIVSGEVTTSLSGEGQTGAEIHVLEGSNVHDTAELHGEHASTATGTVKYEVYSDGKCEEPVASAGEVTVAAGTVPASSNESLPPGVYYWRAEYSGDETNPAANSPCGSEVVLVQTATSVSTSLSGGGESGTEITVPEETAVNDQATLTGTNAASAEGHIRYAVYADSECKELVATAGDYSFKGGSVPASGKVTLPYGTYFWQAEYTGDATNSRSSSTCDSEIEIVTAPLTLTLTGDERTGPVITMPEEGPVTARATLHGAYASSADGKLVYEVFSDSQCTTLVAKAGEVTLSGATAPTSNEETLPEGNYYWQADYLGDELNPPAKSTCQRAIQLQIGPNSKYAALGDSFSSGLGTYELFGTHYYGHTDEWFGRNLCRRSRIAWPARVGDRLFPGSATEAEVLRQQPPHFIFRACAGAVTENLWRAAGGAAAGGQYDEFVIGPPAAWMPTPAQDLWLELPGGTPPPAPPAPNNPNLRIQLVTLTIGGNDAGFATIAEHCVNGLRGYVQATCLNVIDEWRRGVLGAGGTLLPGRGIPLIADKLRTVLEDIHVSAPNAIIRIPLYPQLLNLGAGNPIRVGFGWFTIENPVAPPSVALELTAFVTLLNQEIAATVNAYRVATGVDAEVVQTENAFIGSQLGDLLPFANGVVLPPYREESFHPNCRGHRVLAAAVLRNIGVPILGGWAC